MTVVEKEREGPEDSKLDMGCTLRTASGIRSEL